MDPPPLRLPPPARAQASACKTMALKNNRARRSTTPFSQLFDSIFSSSFEFRVSNFIFGFWLISTIQVHNLPKLNEIEL
jgi:hypothetical protein